MKEKSTIDNDRMRPGRRLLTSLAGGFALVLLLTVASSGTSIPSEAASLRAPLRDDVDLCTVLPRGSDWEVHSIDPTNECGGLNNNPDSQVATAQVTKLESVEQAHTQVQEDHDSVISSGRVPSAAGYGDPGFGYEVAGDVFPASIHFARSCYFVDVEGALDNKHDNKPFAIDQARAVAQSIGFVLRCLMPR